MKITLTPINVRIEALQQKLIIYTSGCITGSGGGAVDSVNGQTGVVVLDTTDIAEGTDANYVSDAEKTIIGNTSGINTGDQVVPVTTYYNKILTVADWTANKQTITVAGVTAINDIETAPLNTIIDSQAYGTAFIVPITQATGTIEFECVTTPTADINIIVGVTE